MCQRSEFLSSCVETKLIKEQDNSQREEGVLGQKMVRKWLGNKVLSSWRPVPRKAKTSWTALCYLQGKCAVMRTWRFRHLLCLSGWWHSVPTTNWFFRTKIKNLVVYCDNIYYLEKIVDGRIRRSDSWHNDDSLTHFHIPNLEMLSHI